MPLGELAGDVRLMPGTLRRGRATYELLVANDTPLPVATFAYAPDGARGYAGSARLTWNAIVVPPYSAIAIAIDVALPRRGRATRVVAELHAREAQLTLDAAAPRDPARTLLTRAGSAVAAFALLCLGAACIADQRPRVTLAAPAAVRGGVAFDVAYALGGGTTGDYVVETPDGMQIGRGRLARDAGSFSVSLPAATVSNGYDVRVTARGPFGSDERTTHVVALAAPPAAPAPVKQARRGLAARISSLQLAADDVRGGEPIVVDYRTAARAGAVRLIDEEGTVRAEALLNRSGRSILVAPYTDADQDFRVVVTTERGTSRDEAQVPVRIARTVPGPTTGTTAIPDASTPAVADGTAPIAVPATARAGTSLTVTIMRHEPALRVALVDGNGTELSSRDVPPSAATVALATPANGTRNIRASVVATFAKGFGQETVIRPVTLEATAGR